MTTFSHSSVLSTRRLLGLILLLVGCRAASLPEAPPPPTATIPAPPPTPIVLPPQPTATLWLDPAPASNLFTVSPNGQTPIVYRGLPQQFDASYVGPGAVIWHEGLFHMFRNGYRAQPGVLNVGYMTSPDGLHWTSIQEEPVFSSQLIRYPVRSSSAIISSVVALDDLWVMYFHTMGGSDSRIGRATAPAPAGPWTVDPVPLLEPGESGAWDDRNVLWPNVQKTESGYLMVYAGQNWRGGTAIGVATSIDGITWERRAEPVLEAQLSWEGRQVNRPELTFDGEQWVMIYQGGERLTHRGLAFSQDGLHWQPEAEGPLLTSATLPAIGYAYDAALVYAEGRYFYFVEIGSASYTNIYLLIHEGPLRES